MKESMEDRIIERYLNGEMRPDEEKEFRALLEIEPELKRRMDAEKIVQRAMEHDLAEMQHEEGGSYARFLAALATSVPAAEGVLMQGAGSSTATTGVAGSTAAGAGSVGAASGGFVSALLATGVAKGLIGVAMVATLATGVYVATPGDPAHEERNPAAVAPPAAAMKESLPEMIDSTAGSQSAPRQKIAEPMAAPTAGEEKNEMKRNDPATPDLVTSGSIREEQSEKSRSSMKQEAVAPVEKKENGLDAMLKNMEKDASRTIEVIESDTAATKLKMGQKKQ